MKKKNPVQILFHSKRPHAITKMHNNMNMCTWIVQ